MVILKRMIAKIINFPSQRLVRALFAAGWVLSFCCSAQTNSRPDRLPARLDSLFASVPDFSGVVLIARNAQPLYHRAFGYRQYATGQKNDINSIFELASVSKQFTAMAVMMLKEKGLLTWDDPLAKFIPSLPYPNITIRHLLNHTSGLPDYQAVMDQHWDKSKVANNNDNIAMLERHRPPARFEPGTRYEYSNTGYMLLASVVEKVSGEDFIDFCRNRLFQPLQMNQTDIRTRAEKHQLPTMAWGHLPAPDGKTFLPADSFPAFNYTIWLGNRKGPGRISATAADLLRWDEALYTGQLVTPFTLGEAFSPAKLNDGSLSQYGFGWDLAIDPAMGRVVRHSGDNPGYKTQIIRYIDRHETVILLCNNAHPRFDNVLATIEKMLAQSAQKLKR